MFLFKMWFLFVLLFSPVTSNAFKSRSNHELTVLKKLIQTWIIFFLKGQKMLVLKIHYFIDGIHWSAYALGPIGKDTNLVHSPALPPSLCISAVLLHDKALLKKKKKSFQRWRNTSVKVELHSQFLYLAAVTKLCLLKITEFYWLSWFYSGSQYLGVFLGLSVSAMLFSGGQQWMIVIYLGVAKVSRLPSGIVVYSWKISVQLFHL